MTSKREWDLFAIGQWTRGVEKYLENSPIFDIPLYTQFQMMEQHPALKELWNQYCVFLLLCYNQQHKIDTK